MKRASQFAFILPGLFLAFFLFGITDIGQTLLRGPIPPNAPIGNSMTSTWARDLRHGFTV
jgi:hypothetical protein